MRLGTFLTIFFPTILLNLISHATNFFKEFFFEVGKSSPARAYSPIILIVGSNYSEPYLHACVDNDVYQRLKQSPCYFLHEDD